MDYVVIYAAVVATIAVGWRIYEWHRRRPQIKVKMRFLQKHGVLGIDSSKKFISVVAMNAGHYPTTISRSGFRMSNERDLQHMDSVMSRQLPYRLDVGQSVEVEYDLENLRESLRKEGEGVHIKFAWFCDQADRLYKGKLTKPIRDSLRQL